MSDLKFRFGIIKRSNDEAIPEDEPVFILRARDRLAIPTLVTYLKFSELDGCNDHHKETLAEAVAAFEEFADQNPDRMKQPGVTRGR